MEASAFGEGLSSGHAGIDAQHQELAAASAELRVLLEAEDRLAAGPALERLRLATQAHFRFEEELMAQGYVHARNHREDHASFLAELGRISAELETGITAKVRLWVASRYLSWFRYHARSADAGLARYLRRREEELAAAAQAGAQAAPDAGPKAKAAPAAAP